MKKTFKRLGAMFLAMVMAVSVLCTGAFADDQDTTTSTYTITVNGKAGHTYQAYQIFTGTVSGNGKTLSDIKWGNGVTPATLLEKLQADTTISSKFSGITDAASNAEKIAEIIGTFDSSSREAYAVADAVEASVTNTSATGTIANNATSTTISVNSAGYYLVKDANKSQGDDSQMVYTRNILQIVQPNTTITTKDAVPSLKKTIIGINDDTSKDLTANTAGMGDKVNYKLTATVPDMSGYTSYTFMITDTMSKGLTFNNDVAIKIGDTTLASDAFTVSEVTTDNSGNQTFTITINNFINYTGDAGKTIEVTYSATLNEKADLSTAGNTNEAKITYSNDPNDDKSTGETSTSKVKTYTTGLKLEKVKDNNGQAGEPLTGAKFKISGTGSKVILVNSTIYNKDDSGTYYLLKNGTYTTTAPDDDTKDTYDSTTQKYKKIDTVTQESVPDTFETEAYVDSNGVLKIEGLGEGTYTITELVAPDGYNLLTEPITITISASEVTFDSCTWSVKKGEETLNTDNTDTNLYVFKVINKAGSNLPSTGGMGTKLFYTIGGLLMAGAAIVLVIKKRRSTAE